MLCVYFLILVAALAVAAPPSHNYLPPSPTSRNNGYPDDAPGSSGFQATQIDATSTSEGGNSLSRTSPSKYHAAGRVPSQGYDDNATAFARNSIEANSVRQQ